LPDSRSILTVTITTLECIFLSDPLVAPLKNHFKTYRTAQTEANFNTAQPYGIESRPSSKAVARMLTGILAVGGTGSGKGSGTRIYGGSLSRSDPRGVIACDCASRIAAWLHHPHSLFTSTFLARRCRAFHRRKTLNPRRLVTIRRAARKPRRNHNNDRFHYNTSNCGRAL
jgi:hypothetical protein